MNTQTTQKSLPIYRESLHFFLRLPSTASALSLCSIPGQEFPLFPVFPTLFLRLSEDKPWNMDLHVSGTSGTGADDPAEKIRSPVSIQLRSRIRFRGAA